LLGNGKTLRNAGVHWDKVKAQVEHVEKDELLLELERIFQPSANQNNFSPDYRVAPALGVLVRAVVRLDKSSSRLATVNIWLTVVILVVGLLQVVLVFRGH